MNFQKIILVLAILLLIGALIFIGISLKQSKKNATWPPLIPDCPDYWVAFDPNTMDGTPYGLANSSTYLATIGQNTCTNGVSTSTTSTTPTSTSSNSGAICINTKNLGTCPAPSGQKYTIMDFTQDQYQGSNGNCKKYQWATSCNISWDGITYGVQKSPCDTGSSSNLT